MEKVRFGKTGLMVSKIAFGGIPIQSLSVPEAIEVVQRVIGLGVNFLDTANVYSDSEEKIGLAIKDVPRESLVIATKSIAKDKKTFLENLDLSLTRLGTDYIDLYQHHNVSSAESYNAIMGESGAYEGMMEAIRAGKVRFPAFTSHSIPIAIKIMQEEKFDAVQLPFNYVDDEAAKEAIPLAKKLDMGFIAMKPFGGGMLSDANLSIKYLSQFDSIVPDPGVKSLSEIEEIVRIVELGEEFTAGDAVAIEKIKTEFGSSWCHRCDYCKPCPQKIDISVVLTIESAFKRMPVQRIISYAGKAMETARTCVGCGECKGRCPYNLDIPTLLTEKLAFWDKAMAD